MKNFGGFDHNEQCLRILTDLENRYFGFNGLNLSWETLEGIVKHNGIIKNPKTFIANLDLSFDLKLSKNTSIEGQIASISDDVAYMSHDFDDGLNYGLFNLDEIQNLPIIGEKIAAIIEKQPNIEKNILIHEMIRRLVSGLIDDILKETIDRINYFRPENVDQVRNCGSLLVCFSEKVKYELKILRSFLNRKMWRHPRFEKIRKLSQEIHERGGRRFDGDDNLSFLTDRNAKIKYNKYL